MNSQCVWRVNCEPAWAGDAVRCAPSHSHTVTLYFGLGDCAVLCVFCEERCEDCDNNNDNDNHDHDKNNLYDTEAFR